MTGEQIIAAIVRIGTARRSLEAILRLEDDAINELIAVARTTLIEADRRLQEQLHKARGG